MSKLRIFAGTYNVNAKGPAGLDLRNWLCKSATAPDIVSVSLQEVVELGNVTTYVQNTRSEEASERWARAFVRCLESYTPYGGAQYAVLAVSQLIGVMTCVLIRAEHISAVSQLMIGYYAVGRFGVLGNKGAVAVRFRLRTGPRKHKSLCFVGSHLSAHQKEVAKRNADFAAIMGGLQFLPLDRKASKEFLSKGIVPVEKILGLRGRTVSVASASSGASSADREASERAGKAGRRAGDNDEAEEPEEFEQELEQGSASTTKARSGKPRPASKSARARLSKRLSRLAPTRRRTQDRRPPSGSPQSTQSQQSPQALLRAAKSQGGSKDSLRRQRRAKKQQQQQQQQEGGELQQQPQLEQVEDFSRQADLIAAATGQTGAPTIRIDDHDIVLWFGDLNYRVDGFSWHEMLALVRQKSLSTLLEHDQLSAERAHGRAFQTFSEGLITFAPTYKYAPGTSNFDTAASADGKKKVRCPAWCDRVLWKLNDRAAGSQMQLCAYFAAPDLRASDHKPVGAEFVLPFVELGSGNGAGGLAGLGRLGSGVLAMPLADSLPDADARSPLLRAESDGDLLHLGTDAARARRSRSASGGGDTAYPLMHAASTGGALQPSDLVRFDDAPPPQGHELEQDPVRTVCAVRDFRAAHADELGFAKGELLEVFMSEKLRVNDGWLLGRRVVDGAAGYFPSARVQALGAVSRGAGHGSGRTRAALHKASARRYHRKREERAEARAAEAEAARAEQQLLQRQQQLQQQQLQQQSLARRAGRALFQRTRGAVAASAQAVAATVAASVSARRSPQETQRSWSEEFFEPLVRRAKYVAARDYDARSGDELSFRRGDILEVVSMCPDEEVSEDGWWVGQLHGEQGLVPRAYFLPPVVAATT